MAIENAMAMERGYGITDTQEKSPQIVAICLCGNDIYPWDDVWELDGELSCSAECCCKRVGASEGEASELVELNE